MSLASTSLFVFILITSLFFIVKFFVNENIHNTVSIIYLCFLFIIQLFFAYRQTIEYCGSPQFKTLFIWGLIPWFLIFFGVIVLINTFPGWKSPFSNTFGYLIAKLFGLNTVFNNILKSDFESEDKGLNNIMKNLYQDKTIIINEINPINFNSAISKLQPLFNTGSQIYNENIEKLKKLVLLKDYISQFIWYILTGSLVLSMSNMGMVASKCNKDPEQLISSVENYNAKLKQDTTLKQQDLQNQKKFIIRD